MQVVRFNPILCCSILRNAPHFFVSTSAIPVNSYLTECDFVRKTRLPPDKLLKINNLSVETYHLTDKLHFESQWLQELVLHNRDHKKTWKSNEQESLFLLLIVRIDSNRFIGGDCLKSQILLSENRESAFGLV